MSNSMIFIKDIESVIKEHIKLWSSKTLFIVLNKTLLQAYCNWSLTSICLHLTLKYKCLQWPKLASNDVSQTPVILVSYTN